MASHITDAEYPTELSKQGLSLYQSQQDETTSTSLNAPQPLPSQHLSFYPVDCHPLTIRYALIRSKQWQDENQQEAVMEYLTQIMFEADSPAQLYVGFFKGKPAACGMLYQNEQGSLISDVYALPLPNQAELIAEMTAYLSTQASADSLYIEH